MHDPGGGPRPTTPHDPVERSRAARESRAFRPAALARRGRLATSAEDLVPPRWTALLGLWTLAFTLAASGLWLTSRHLDIAGVLRTLLAAGGP